MVEITVKVNLDNQYTEKGGPIAVLVLQAIATFMVLVYVVYEAAYPYLVGRRAAQQR